MRDTATNVIVASAAWLAFLHAMAPDHWVPFVALGKASHWSRKHLLGVTFLAGLGHVSSSLAIGLVGVALGRGLSDLQQIDIDRAAMAQYLLIGFGAAYMAWGIKHARHGVDHEHLTVDNFSQAAKLSMSRRFWTLFAVMVFGPCEPMIPLIFLAWTKSLGVVLLTVAVFCVITIAMVMTQSLLAYEGAGIFWSKHEGLLARHSHTIAGATIVVVGLMVILFGL
ncbi:MAG: hypothetical protein HY547_07135 [Elusimicrobia bacterium]|nr:hypothetical protein [Elusimicrobiota bacterium]